MGGVLFVTWDGGGNLPPALGVAAELRGRGLEARFLGHAAQRAAIEAAGFRFTAYAHGRPWSSAEPATGAAALERISVFTDPGAGIDLLETARREPPAMTVIDCLSLGALHAAQQARLAHIGLAHTYLHYLRHALAAARRAG